MNKFPVVILGGGESGRMFPLNTQHKALIELAGQTLLERTISNLLDANFSKIVVIINNQSNKELLLDKFGDKVTVLVQDNATGMGEALLLAEDHLDDKFFVISPYHFKSPEVLDKLAETKYDQAITVAETNIPQLYGIAEVDQDKALSIIEKPSPDQTNSNLRVVATYLLSRDFLTQLADTKKEQYSFETALDAEMKAGRVGFATIDLELPSLKYAWHFFDHFKAIMTDQTTHLSPQAEISKTAIIDDSSGAVIVEDRARIGDFAKIVGPCYIGRDSLVGDYSFVRGSSIESEVAVGAKTEVVRSIIFRGSSIHFGYIADSIVGSSTKIGAGLITANKRLDRDQIKVTIKNKPVETRRRALGLICGEKSKIGIRVSTMPGTLIESNTTIFPSEELK